MGWGDPYSCWWAHHQGNPACRLLLCARHHNDHLERQHTNNNKPKLHKSYIEYEVKLDRLRRHRRRALGLAGTKKGIADYALVRRTHFIYERAARRFKSDLRLWAQWLAFCRETRESFFFASSFFCLRF